MERRFQWQVSSAHWQSRQLLIGRQLGYGFGTARYKSDANAPADKELVKIGVMAIKAGFYHLDGAQGLQIQQLPWRPKLTYPSLWQ